MKTERDFLEIDLLITSKEELVCSGRRSSADIGSRDLSEDTYRIYPFSGKPILVTRAEFAAFLFGRYSPRLSRADLVTLRRLVQDLDEGQWGSGFQHLPLQGLDTVVGANRLVLQCFIDREGLNGQPPSVTWNIIPDCMVGYFESVARPAGRILIDG